MRRAGPAIIEQAIWSVAGFLVAALAGRLLGVADFGVYALAMVVLFGVGGLVNSLVIEPASVVGPRFFDDDLHRYGGLLVAVAAATGAVAAILGVVLFVVGSGDLLTSVAAGMVISFPTLVAWTARRLPYLTSQPTKALIGSIVYLIAVVGGFLAWNASMGLTVVSAVLLMGVAAVLHSLAMFVLWRPVWSGLRDPAMRRTSVVAHWDYGRWYLATEASSWMLNYGFAALSAAVLSLSAAGGYRASQVLMRPYGVVYQGLGLYLLPRYTRQVAQKGMGSLIPDIRRVGIGLMSLAVAAFVVLLIWGGDVMRLVFGPDFEPFGGLAAAMVGSMIFHAWIVAISMALPAAGFPRDVFFGQLASAIVSVVAGVGLGVTFGLGGLVAALWLATIVRAIVVYWFFRRRLAEERQALAGQIQSYGG
jgi:O-antigen/teichoic acid export membrane protein